MKGFIVVLMAVFLVGAAVSRPVYANENTSYGEISGKTFVAGLLSLFIWPGIGQYMNDNPEKKNITHAVIGLFPPFRLWSGWDALVDRKGGLWDGKI